MTDYERYLHLLSELSDLPSSQDGQTRAVSETYARSVAWADDALEEATTFAADRSARLTRHLSNAARFVAQGGHPARVPERIRPSVVPLTATKADVDSAMAELATATEGLGEIATAPRPVARVRSDPVVPVPQVRRRRASPQVWIGAVVAVALVVIALLVL